jgi:NTE family protein
MNNLPYPNFGLVLTGGGAKGAYQAGALQYIAELGLIPNIIAGTSIEKLLKETVDISELKKGIELWVTVFPALKIPGLDYEWIIDLIRAKMGTDAHWICAQDCHNSETLYNLLLASSALPLAFPSRKVNDKKYIDGGLADNIPIRALKNRGCQNIIVIHLRNGLVWNRSDFAEQTIIEIRPEKPINKAETLLGLVDTWLDFSSERIAELKQRGYEDAKRCLIPITETFMVVKEQRNIQKSLINSTQMLIDNLPL